MNFVLENYNLRHNCMKNIAIIFHNNMDAQVVKRHFISEKLIMLIMAEQKRKKVVQRLIFNNVIYGRKAFSIAPRHFRSVKEIAYVWLSKLEGSYYDGLAQRFAGDN